MSFVFDINKRIYKNVAASSAETLDYTPTNGEEMFLVNAGVSSSQVPATVACIVWDPAGTPEIVMSSYGESHHENINKTYIGDGTKVMRICLTNDLTEPAHMGGYFQAVKL